MLVSARLKRSRSTTTPSASSPSSSNVFSAVEPRARGRRTTSWSRLGDRDGLRAEALVACSRRGCRRTGCRSVVRARPLVPPPARGGRPGRRAGSRSPAGARVARTAVCAGRGRCSVTRNRRASSASARRWAVSPSAAVMPSTACAMFAISPIRLRGTAIVKSPPATLSTWALSLASGATIQRPASQIATASPASRTMTPVRSATSACVARGCGSVIEVGDAESRLRASRSV